MRRPPADNNVPQQVGRGTRRAPERGRCWNRAPSCGVRVKAELTADPAATTENRSWPNMARSSIARACRGQVHVFGQRSCGNGMPFGRKMDQSPSTARGGQSHFRGEQGRLQGNDHRAAKIGTVPSTQLFGLCLWNSGCRGTMSDRPRLTARCFSLFTGWDVYTPMHYV